MNKIEADILQVICENGGQTQRAIAEATGHSLGIVNRTIHSLICEGWMTELLQPSAIALQKYTKCRPDNAVILAAGFGMRMVPINLLTPKALLEVRGEVLIERLIRQLHEVGIERIDVVVGFMKEKFEYLIDQYHVNLIVNPSYQRKNNLHSLLRAEQKLDRSYIIPSDIWFEENPFRSHEWYSWYMVSESEDPTSSVRVGRNGDLIRAGAFEKKNRMIGLAYISEEDSPAIREQLKTFAADSRYDEAFWEDVLWEGQRMRISSRMFPDKKAIEINTYEQLREFDKNSSSLESGAIDVITRIFDANPEDVTDIAVLKKGMTNRSFLFSVKGKKYIMRIPGEGTDQLIDRKNEYRVYQAIKGFGICDDPVFIDPNTGYKITAYLEKVRVCDTDSIEDLERCMKKLREFHHLKLTVPHSFDIFGQIAFYESLWKSRESAYDDYLQTKENVLSLKSFIDAEEKELCLTHIDAVPDNFLFYEANGNEQLQLTDWEYAGMQDPHVDIAMFCIYSLYDKQQVDRLIDIYFQGQCPKRIRKKIYCYISACGLLWSNWCEFKHQLGVEFGEYSLRQYRYAKEYYRYALQE